MAQINPYSAQKKKYPLGDEFDKILPLKIGNWNRFAFHDFVIGRENGSVYYRQDDRQIYITFGKTYNQTDLNSIKEEVKKTPKPKTPKKVDGGTEPKKPTNSRSILQNRQV